MKKKTSKIIKTQNSKLKRTKLNVIKESQVEYRPDKDRIKKPLYTNEQIGKINIVKDFLPAPEELVLKDTNIKVTLNLSKTSVDFFKALAEKNKSQYQKVIRNLLDRYTQNFTGQF